MSDDFNLRWQQWILLCYFIIIIIISLYFGQKRWFKDKTLMMDLFFTNMQLFTSQDINWWTGVWWITCGLLWCFYQLFDFELIYILDGLRASTFSAKKMFTLLLFLVQIKHIWVILSIYSKTLWRINHTKLLQTAGARFHPAWHLI